jgi:hypothetical protein
VSGSIRRLSKEDLDQAKYTAMVLKDLQEVWPDPHIGQIEIGRAVFGEGARYVGVECGRNFGKTEILAYILHRWAMLIPNEQFYYVAPFYNQACELVWESGRLPNFLKHLREKYVAKVNETEHRMHFKNGSFIKLLGADNFETARGLKPRGVGYDEFKDFDYRFHKRMADNLGAKKAPIVIVGTPPEEEDHFFFTVMDDFKVRKGGRWFNFPTSVNHHFPPEEIEEARLSAIRRNDYAEFEREWLAKRVRGGASSIFPMLDLPPINPLTKAYEGTSKQVLRYADIVSVIKRRPKDWELYDTYDPGTTVCFAAPFMAINKWDKRVILLDEIYETDQMKTTTNQIYPRAKEKMAEVTWDEDAWLGTYDEAGVWFATEVAVNYERNLIKSEKRAQKKEDGLGLIKDLMLEGLWFMTERCQKAMWEMANYYKDDKGKIPKKNDHLIDAIRYTLIRAGYDHIPKDRKPIDDEFRRVFKLSIDISEPSEDDPDDLSVAEQFEQILRRAE